MGKYLNVINGIGMGSSFREKSTAIEQNGGTKIDQPTEFESDLVCIVDNGYFGAAAYCYSKSELEHFSREDGRPKQWYKFPNAAVYATD
jgi:hypothetical protein